MRRIVRNFGVWKSIETADSYASISSTFRLKLCDCSPPLGCGIESVERARIPVEFHPHWAARARACRSQDKPHSLAILVQISLFRSDLVRVGPRHFLSDKARTRLPRVTRFNAPREAYKDVRSDTADEQPCKTGCPSFTVLRLIYFRKTPGCVLMICACFWGFWGSFVLALCARTRGKRVNLGQNKR